MKQWFISKFKKTVAVRIYYITAEKRIKHYWAIPTADSIVKIGGLTFVLNNKSYYLKDNVPTYYFTFKNAEPIDILEKEQPTVYTPLELHTILEAKISEEIFNASKSSKISTETILLLGGMFVGFIVLGYYLTSKIAELQVIIENLTVGG